MMSINKVLSTTAVVTLAFVLSGCAGMSREDKGTLAGAAIGATAIGLATDSAGGAVVGAAGGAIVGRAIASGTDKDKK